MSSTFGNYSGQPAYESLYAALKQLYYPENVSQSMETRLPRLPRLPRKLKKQLKKEFQVGKRFTKELSKDNCELRELNELTNFQIENMPFHITYLIGCARHKQPVYPSQIKVGILHYPEYFKIGKNRRELPLRFQYPRTFWEITF